MNRPLTAEYIVELFESVRNCSSEDWVHNKKRFIEIIGEYGIQHFTSRDDVKKQSEQYHCELFDFNRCEKPCDKQCYSCYWMESKKQ